MGKKKIRIRRKQLNGTTFRDKPESKIISTNASKSLAVTVIKAPVVDHNNPRTENFVPLLRVMIDSTSSYLGLRNVRRPFRTTTTFPKLASYMDMSKETRSIVLQFVLSMGAAPSRRVAKFLGYLNARQVGQIRRWHVQDWRTYRNR